MKINWTIPNFKDEIGEYFENDYTTRAFARRGLEFDNDQQLLEFLNNGKLVDISRDELSTNYDNLTLNDVDFIGELEDKDYAESFYRMDNILKRDKEISLPAPIIIKFNDGYYGFSGNRRMNLAFSNNIPLKVWMVNPT